MDLPTLNTTASTLLVLLFMLSCLPSSSFLLHSFGDCRRRSRYYGTGNAAAASSASFGAAFRIAPAVDATRQHRLAAAVVSPDADNNGPQGDDADSDHDNNNEDVVVATEVAVAIDRDRHVRILNDNLIRCTGKSLLHYMKPDSVLQEDEGGDVKGDGDGTMTDHPPFWEEDVHMSLRYALSSHGTEETNRFDGPVNNYGNFACLMAYSYSRDHYLQVPAARLSPTDSDRYDFSRIIAQLRPTPATTTEATTAPAGDDDDDEERRRHQQQEQDGNHKIRKDDIIMNYEGFRWTLDQRRFYVQNAMIWNCYDDDGKYYGQAILFDREKITWMD